MTAKHTTTKVQFKRFVNRTKGTNVQAFQFPAEDIDWLRRVWKQPTAEPGNWLVKTGTGTATQGYNLLTNNKFTELYREPETRRPTLALRYKDYISLDGTKQLVAATRLMASDLGIVSQFWDVTAINAGSYLVEFPDGTVKVIEAGTFRFDYGIKIEGDE